MTKNKVNPGKGYRLLKEGEEILETDEHWAHGEGPWISSQGNRGQRLSKFHVPFRRKAEPSKGWNVTFKSRQCARYAIEFLKDHACDNYVIRGPHKA